MKTFLLLLTGLDIVWSKIMGDTEAEIPKKWCNFSGTSQTVLTVLKVKMIFFGWDKCPKETCPLGINENISKFLIFAFEVGNSRKIYFSKGE